MLLERLYLALLCDIRESDNEELIAFAATLIPYELSFHQLSLTTSDSHGISLVLKKVAKKINLYLSQCNMDDQSFSYIVSAIKQMPGSVSDGFK